MGKERFSEFTCVLLEAVAAAKNGAPLTLIVLGAGVS